MLTVENAVCCRVRQLARLTVALYKLGRVVMFGPGTACRCSTCINLPPHCQWGGGPYAGTLLLYLQEIAVNHLLTQQEWDSLPPRLLDQGVRDESSVCGPALLHCYHHDERFSKFAFARGEYRDLDLSKLDITKVKPEPHFKCIANKSVMPMFPRRN